VPLPTGLASAFWGVCLHTRENVPRDALSQVAILTDQRPELAVVDRGYRGHDEAKTRILISGTRGGLTAKEIIDLRRRSAIEAEIGHMKTDGRLSRCPLKGTICAQSSPS
jgi:IS5 family transposase